MWPWSLRSKKVRLTEGSPVEAIERWLARSAFPEQQPRPRKTGLDSYLPYLRQRWEAGCHNIAQLYRELVARGYTHSYHSVHEQLVRLCAIREEERRQGMPASRQLLCPLGRRPSFSFVGLNNWRPMNKKHSSRFDTFIQRST